jgi:hypothetical protein
LHMYPIQTTHMHPNEMIKKDISWLAYDHLKARFN